MMRKNLPKFPLLKKAIAAAPWDDTTWFFDVLVKSTLADWTGAVKSMEKAAKSYDGESAI
jgi:hypothetical protein